MQRIYFDNAATTPLDPRVAEVMMESMRSLYGNPSSIHNEGRTARAAVEHARKQAAELLGASIGEIFFTSGGTESNNMVLKCAVRDLGVTRIISSPLEHHCVLHAADTLQRTGLAERVLVRVDAKGQPDMGHIQSLLKEERAGRTLVSLMLANNEIGTLIDLAEVGSLCKEHGALFHSDTVQAIGYYPFNLEELPVDFITGSAHKFHGPKGVGFVYINSEHTLKPFMDGGAQERNMRGGTENIAGIQGMAAALRLAHEEMDSRRAAIQGIRDYFKSKLEQHFDGLEFNGDPANGHYKLLSVGFPPSPKAELLLLNLDIAGISVSGGSACSSGADAGSHVIHALKGDDPRKTIRFSFSHHNTREEVDKAISQLIKIIPAGQPAG
ncbi:cysteine desulfurase family protein [Phaeodactylibacter luteus]|uniref:cysteine desulfurase n=1 Tax=Phaeodactylibacter luteus TaxID=1564516 RepID=A0A5C6RI75_9BACT|nr:cysteine desulfurase family protein [Phaeodactylibacter luteus]TXB61991.1 cysteine desulfurase [Phaeodactylibacter luteus]